MPVLTANKRQGIRVFNGANAGPQAQVPRFFYDTGGLGVPRFEDLITIRLLERTHTVSLALDTIQGQVTTTPWVVRPTVDKPSSAHKKAAEELTHFLDGHFNANHESLDHLLKQWVNDVLSIDAGILELVPFEEEPHYLAEIYARDGASFVKAPDKHGRMPGPGSPMPAYWQFPFSFAQRPFQSGIDVRDLATTLPGFVFGHQWHRPIPFSRDQLVWTEASPRSWSMYGLGRVQKVQRIAEILLNQDLVNRSYFQANELPEGLLHLQEAAAEEIQRFREYWKDEIQGKHHKLPIIGGKGASWVPFRPTLADLQFLDSQKWYNKLVWMLFGLSANEVGDIEDVNRNTAQEQTATIHRKTTRPLLQMLAAEINRDVLPFTEAWQSVNGEVEFAWVFNNPAIEALERQKQREDLESGLATVNEVRQSRGLEPLPWGDMPLELMRSVSRAHPEWALGQWAGVDEADLPEPSIGLGFLSARPGTTRGHQGDGAMAPRIRALKRAVAKVILEAADDVEQELQAAYPAEEARAGPAGERKAPAVNLDRIVQALSIRDALVRVVLDHATQAMGDAAEVHAERLEAELRQRLGAEAADVSLEFRVQDSAALQLLRERAAARMTTVEATVRDAIRQALTAVVERGGNVTQATQVLHQTFDQLSEAHAELVARTEILSAARHGSQALAESTDLVAGKRWRATKDGRTRSWHLAMDGVVVPKDQPFVVPRVGDERQPLDYPREAFVVGDDQPFNCRCSQELELKDDLPKTARGLAELRGVRMRSGAVGLPRVETAPGPRAREVLRAHGQPGETFQAMVKRLEGAHSRNELTRVLGVSKATLYDWLGRVQD